MTFGERVKKIREEKGLSQRQLGERMGVKQQTIAQYERALNTPKLETVRRLASALKVPLSALDPILYEHDIINLFSGVASIKEVNNTADITIDNEMILFTEPEKSVLRPTDQKLLESFNQLNETGQEKAVEQVELLTKIPEYRKDEQPNSKKVYLQAAHADNPTPEQKAAADRIMEDDSEWE